MNGPAIQCPSCSQEKGLFDFQINESATLTCPVCSTQFAITATVKSKSQVDIQPQEPDLPKPPGAEVGGAASPMAPAPQMTPPPPPPSNIQASLDSRIDNLVDDLNQGMDLPVAISKFLGEKEVEKEEWKGGLSTFNSKLQSLAKDLNYSGDLGDLVKDLQEGDALSLSGDNVKLDIEKAKSVLIKHLLGRGPNKFPNPEMSGDLLGDEDWRDLDFEGGAGGGAFTPGSVTKAIETYFS